MFFSFLNYVLLDSKLKNRDFIAISNNIVTSCDQPMSLINIMSDYVIIIMMYVFDYRTAALSYDADTFTKSSQHRRRNSLFCVTVLVAFLVAFFVSIFHSGRPIWNANSAMVMEATAF